MTRSRPSWQKSMSKSGIDTRSGIQEALEEQVVAQRVEIGDAEAVGDERARARAAARPDRHAVRLRPVDEIGDDEEVAGETHLHDRVELEIEAREIARPLRRAPLGVGIKRFQPLLEPFGRASRRYSSRPTPPGVGKRGSWLFPSVSFRLQRLAISTLLASASGMSLKKLGHLGLGLEILLAAESLRTALVREDVAFGDAHPRFVRAKVVGPSRTGRGASRPAAARAPMRGARHAEHGLPAARPRLRSSQPRHPLSAARCSNGWEKAPATRTRAPAQARVLSTSSACPTSPRCAPESAISPSVPISENQLLRSSARPR